MALGDVMARLSVALDMNTASFERGAKKTEGTLGKLKGLLIGPIGLAAAAGAAGGAIIALGIASIKAADDMSKAAQSIGIGTEELSRLAYAADLSGTSFEQLTKGVGRLARNMNDASNGLAAPARAFDQLGISVTNNDGTLRTASDVIGDIADKFAGMEDGAKKTAIAQELLGRAGADMIPFLNQGREGIAQLTEEAEYFGIVIDEETGRQAEQFNDNLSRLGGVASALATRLAAELLPQLVEFTNWLASNGRTLVAHAGKVAEWATFLAKSVRYAYNEMKYVWDFAAYADSTLPRWLGGTGKNLAPPVNQNDLNAVSDMVGRVSRLATSFTGARTESEQMAASFGDLPAHAIAAGDAAGKGISKGISDGVKEAEASARELGRIMDRLFPEVAARAAYAAERATLVAAGATEATLRKLADEYDQANKAKRPEFDFGTDPLTSGISNVGEAIKDLTDKAKDNTVRIAKSFKDMAEETMASLSNLTNSIKSGGFLGILESVIGLGLQLGGIGAFGSKIAARLNSIPAHANGTSFAPGGLTLVGERGPELVDMPRGSRVYPNGTGPAGGTLDIRPSPLFEVYLDGKLVQAAPSLVDAGGRAGVARMTYRQSRRIG